MSRILLCTALWAISFGASAQTMDFSTTAGFNASCTTMAGTAAAAAQSDDERVAWVICNDTALTKQIATWADQGMRRMQTEKPAQAEMMSEVYKEIDYAIVQVAASRKVLENIHLGKRKSLRLVPSQWQLDLNGDGKIDTWEKYFFAIPKRRDGHTQFAMPSNDDAYYAREYNLDAAIKVDQSDVLWALSYHDFLESLLSLLRAYHPDEQFNFTLADAAAYHHAMDLALQGLDNSEKLRRSVLAEKSNDEEWIANPDQSNSVFPIALDAADFAAWGKTLAELKELAKGKKLFNLPHRPGMPAGFELCPEGSGLDLHDMMQHPPATLNGLSLMQGSSANRPFCRKIDATHPLSNLAESLNHAGKAGQAEAGMRMLRYMFWVN